MEKEKEGCDSKVMVAIDESESSYYALTWVLNNLKNSIVNSPLLIFSAQPIPKNYSAYAAQLGIARIYFPFSPTLDMISTVQERNKKVSLGILEKAKNICASRGVKAETITELGEPGELICNAVKNYKVNLLVLGKNEGGALKRAFLGSVSSYCLNNAECAVLVVKKNQNEREH
ncbi:hypothetical protein P3X46_031358 [Hevea brasiliensis]|uniref:UspA domain-containing protein n=2 Tax=Hevea brasiliensis TaxID=3981 RepID=A0ABQ9KLL0_HEVBR|nr:hypothetical protein P3X46_031358 [Hevea brasiliensis]